MTDARLLTRSLLAGYPGLVAVPVRIGDPAAVRLLRVGDRVDLLAADPQAESAARVVGRDVPVLAIPAPGARVPRAHHRRPRRGRASRTCRRRTVAQASVTSFLSVVLTR